MGRTVRDGREGNARQQEDAFEKLVSHSPMGIFIAKGKKVVLVNPGFQRITGFSEAELLAMDPLGIVAPESKEEVRQKAIRMVKGESSLPYEFPFIAKSGQRGWAMATVVSTTYEGERAVLGCFMDITQHRRTQAALVESERKYRELVENANSIILRWTKEGIVTFLNEFGQKFFGYAEEEIIGRHVVGTIVPETESTGRDLTTMINEICADPKRFEYNLNENMRRSGERVWIAWTNKVILDENGRMVEILSIGSDITGRKRAEEALREREATLQGVLRTAPIGIGLAYDRIIGWVNENMCKITGYAAEELNGQSARLLYESEEEFERVGLLKYADIRATGVSSVATRWRRRDGQVIDVWLSSSALEPGNLAAGVVFTALDITDHKRAKDRLRQRTKELTALNALARRVGSSLSLEDVMAAALEQTVYPAEPDIVLIYLKENNELALVGARPEIVDPRQEEFLPVVEDLCRHVLEAGKPAYFPARQHDLPCSPKASQEAIQVSCAALPLLSGDQLLGVLALAWASEQDFMALASFLEAAAGEIAMGLRNALLYRQLLQHAKELDRRVEERTVQLRAANKELEAFAYSISHDLRSPLRAVSGFAQIIARRHRQFLNEEGRHYVDNIVQAAERMGQLIDDLLTFSRLGRQALKLQPVPLGEVVTLVLHHLGERMTATKAVIDLPSEWPVIHGEQTLLLEIFTNLLENALTYRRPEVAPHIGVSWRMADDQVVVVAVSDNGVGIAPEYQKKIFNVFQRLHSDEDIPGVGIGLAIVKRAVEVLGGQVWVESEVGQGSTFYLTLPKE